MNSPKEGLIDQENTSKVHFIEPEDKSSNTERLPDIFTQPLKQPVTVEGKQTAWIDDDINT